jgi:hypothetical protein
LQKIVVILLILVAIAEGCSVSRKAGRGTKGTGTGTGIGSANVLENIIENNITNGSFYIPKASVTVTQNNISTKFTANLKFRKPDTLLLSLRSKLGIEAGRAFITSDTILINDRVHKNLIKGNPRNIKSKYGIEPILLYIVLGDLIIDKKDKSRMINCSKGISRTEFEVGNKMVEYTFDCEREKITRAYIGGDITSGNITLDFREFLNHDNLIIPRIVEINDDLSTMNIVVRIEKVENNWNGKIEFVPGPGYEVIRLK